MEGDPFFYKIIYILLCNDPFLTIFTYQYPFLTTFDLANNNESKISFSLESRGYLFACPIANKFKKGFTKEYLIQHGINLIRGE